MQQKQVPFPPHVTEHSDHELNFHLYNLASIFSNVEDKAFCELKLSLEEVMEALLSKTLLILGI